MFPAPVDLGIAQPDRAVCNVRFSTSSNLEGAGGEGRTWYEGGGAAGERAVAEIVDLPADARPGRRRATRSSR